MPLYYAYGDALLTAEESREYKAREQLNDLATEVLDSGPKAGRYVDLGNGVVTAELMSDCLKGVSARPRGRLMSLGVSVAKTKVPFQDIGRSKPLTIDIRVVYPGKYPDGWFGPRTMLVTTAVKSSATFEAQPRAINFLRANTGPREPITTTRATEKGSRVVYYTPATLDREIIADVEITFDNFEQPVFDAVTNAFNAAAAIPVFLPASTYLLAAGQLARIVGAAGERVFDGKPIFSGTESISIDLPGIDPDVAGFMLVTSTNLDAVDPNFRKNYHVDPRTAELVDTKGDPYRGEHPYVVLAADGTLRDDLKDFAPAQASAAILSRFLGIRDGQNESLGPLMDALKLYNDFTYRRRLDDLDKRLAAMTDGPDKEALRADREAILKNIVTEELKKTATV